MLLVHPQFHRCWGKSRHSRSDTDGVLAKGGVKMTGENTGEETVVMNVFDAVSNFVDEQAVEYAAC